MKKKNGFTLIELLAVIVVLAIIALIAVPIILGVIDKAKLGAAKESATGYVKAMEDAMVLSIVKDQESFADTNCTLDDTNKKQANCASGQTVTLNVQGNALDSLYAIVNKKGYVDQATWKQGNFCGTYDSAVGAKAYKCENFTIAAKDVEFIPSNVTDETDPKWATVKDVQAALDYLYGVIG